MRHLRREREEVNELRNGLQGKGKPFKKRKVYGEEEEKEDLNELRNGLQSFEKKKKKTKLCNKLRNRKGKEKSEKRKNLTVKKNKNLV